MRMGKPTGWEAGGYSASYLAKPQASAEWWGFGEQAVLLRERETCYAEGMAPGFASPPLFSGKSITHVSLRLMTNP